MFDWLKKCQDFFGFNPRNFILLSCLITGLSFPFVFLNTDFEDFLAMPFLGAFFGICYALILTFGNAYIFYRGKLTQESSIKEERNKYILRTALIHFCYVVFVSLLLGVLATIFEKGISIEYLIRNVTGSLIYSGIIVVLFESFYYMHQLRKAERREEQLKRQNAESQLEILKNQVKPHFLFNSLNTVVSIIPDEPDKAIDYVQRLSKVYRYILEIKDKKLIPVHEELDCIKDYMYMLRIRFGNNLIFELDESNLDKTHHIVPLSLQLIIENAVKHNIISNKRPLKISISKGKNGSLIVSNNLQIKTQKMPSTGTGLSNIKERYQMLSNKNVDVLQTHDKFIVSIPLLNVA